jgi:hypothetical protein
VSSRVGLASAALQGFEKREIHFGGRKRRGFGQCHVNDIQYSPADDTLVFSAAASRGMQIVSFDVAVPDRRIQEFLARLEGVIETRSQELIALATGAAVTPSVLVPAPDEVARAGV